MERNTFRDTRRGIRPTACHRCRWRKIRCDRRIPRCTQCEKTKVECFRPDLSSGQEVPINYLIQLESCLAELQKELHYKTSQGDTIHSSKPEYFWGSTSVIGFSNDLPSKIQNKLGSDNEVQQEADRETDGEYPIPTTLPAPMIFGDMPSEVILPPKYDVEVYLKKYFEVDNAQIPVLNREWFVTTYHEPIYGPLSPHLQLASEHSSLNLSRRQAGEPPPWTFYDRHKGKDLNQITFSEPQVRCTLYFLFQVLAISTTMLLENPDVSARYHQQAMRYYNSVVMSSDRMTALRAVILLCVYSLSRPAVPGLWHVSGMAMRLCIELGFHNEDFTFWSNADSLSKDEARRLFWCAYILDRRGSMLMGRPTHLSEDFLNVSDFSLADDSLLVFDADLTKLPSCPSYKNVAHALINLLKIQQKIKKNFYDRNDMFQMPQSYLLEVFDEMETKLDDWHQQMPKDSLVTNLSPQFVYLDVNYDTTRILLMRAKFHSKRTGNLQFEKMLETGISVMHNYCVMHDCRIVNYSWVSVNNIFIAMTASLFAIFQLGAVGNTCQIERFDYAERQADGCLSLLQKLQRGCEIAKYSYCALKKMKVNVFGTIQRKNRTADVPLCDNNASVCPDPNTSVASTYNKSSSKPMLQNAEQASSLSEYERNESSRQDLVDKSSERFDFYPGQLFDMSDRFLYETLMCLPDDSTFDDA